MSEKVKLEVTVLSKGEVGRPIGIGTEGIAKTFGKCVVVHVEGTAIDIIVANHRQSYAHAIQFECSGVNWMNYDVTVVKQGYIFPDLKAKGQLCIMSLTGGATPQDTASIPFKRIQRPMFPIDEI